MAIASFAPVTRILAPFIRQTFLVGSQYQERRCFSAISRARRSKPVPITRLKSALSSSTAKEQPKSTNSSGVEVITIDSTIRMKNAALAVCLVGFCFGVANYSMNAVGQAGDNSSDPLAVLKQEAAAAQVQQDRQADEDAKAADIYRQFQAGELDPDYIEEEPETESEGKSWWKFWRRS